MILVQIDRHSVIQVLGSLMSKPEIFNDTDKYLIEVSDFSNQLDKFVFSAIYNLYVNGAEKIHAMDIENYLKSNSYATDLIEKENGRSFLQDCESYSDTENFNYYYNKLKKFSFLRDIQKSGRKIDNIYCEDITNDKYQEINNNFEKMNTSDILNLLRGEIAGYENKYVLNNIVEEGKPSDSIRERVLEWKQKPEIGCHLQGDIFNTITRGGRKGKLYLRSAASGCGKAVPNYIRIPTPNGWRTVGEIKIGDYLFDRMGNPTKVLAVYPQKEKKEIYKVYFKSGRIAECCKDHLWSYYNNSSCNTVLNTASLQEIFNNPLQNVNKGYKKSIPICSPLKYSKKDCLIDPYVMGLIIGDGSFRYDLTQKAFRFSSADEELVIAIKERMGYTKYKKNSEKNYEWIFEANTEKNHKNIWVEDILKDYPELWNLKSEEKFIPDIFLQGSIEQRYDLLAGLLDTDGSIDNKGRVSFSTTSSILRDNIIELCESLGMTANYKIDKREKYSTGECYNVHIFCSKKQKVRIFKLSRKLNKAVSYLNNEKREEKRDRDAIVKIEATGQYTDMTCFWVDNKEHLFLMNNCICTHNTRTLVGDACYIAYPMRYDRARCKWVETGPCEKILYVMTEQEKEEIDSMILAYLTGYNEDVFTYATFDPNDPVIETAIQIMEKYSDNFLYSKVADPCSSIIKNLFRRYNLQFGVENFFYDYIFSSPAMLNEYRDLKIREDRVMSLK